MRRLLVVILALPALLGAETAANLEQSLHDLTFDRDECYRVRDLTIFKEDIKIYLTDGHLIFSKPLLGRRIAAVFSTDVDGGDGEVILLPPNRAERASLASYTNSPNLDEHFRSAVFLFTGGDYDAIVSQLPRNVANRKVPDVAGAMADRWTPVLRNLSDSFQTRVALDLLGGAASHAGLFAGLFQNAKYGSFDLIYDPYGQEQIAAGRVVVRDNRTFFDTWTSFQARSSRLHPQPRRDDFILSDYRIQATLNPDLSLDCTTRVKVKPLVDGGAVSFQMAPEMTVASASVDGEPAEVLQHESLRAAEGSENEFFLVFPHEPLRAGRVYEFEIKHSGKVIHDVGEHVYSVSARGNWYPGYNLQFAQYDIEFRYPADLDLVAAGDVVEDRTEGEQRITRRRTASPIRFAAFNLGHYEHVQMEGSGYVVDVCANRSLENALLPPPELPTPPVMLRRGSIPQGPVLSPAAPSPTGRLQSLASEVASSLDFMVSKFGPPALPHITVSPIPGTFGQGFPGLIYISTLAYLKDLPGLHARDAETQELYFDELLQAHEVAHQWWGNRVTSLFYRDGWLMEALANVSALLYIEKFKGEHSAGLLLDTYRTMLLQKTPNGETVESAGPLTFGPRLTSSQSPAAYRVITYGKGIWVMQMLRRRMGDERFLAMLRELVRRYDHREISTDEFRQLAVEFLSPGGDDPKLERFFAQWIYGTGIPNLKLTYTLKGKAPDFRLVGTVTQSDVDDEFSTLAPVEIQVARGQTITRWVRTSGDPATFTVPLKQAPLKVTLDPHDAVLRQM